MPIFSRRSVQRMLDENADVVSKAVMKRHVAALNRGNDAALAVEWEVAVLNALARIGNLTHPEEQQSVRTPDALFHCHAHDVQIVADIAAVSDINENTRRVVAFEEELRRQLAKLDADDLRGGLGWKVEEKLRRHIFWPTRGSHKRAVLLPQQHELKRRIFNHRFRRFVSAIKEQPTVSRHYHVKDEVTDVLIHFNAGGSGFYGSYPGFTACYSLDKNPIANALNDKAKQLRKANGVKGIFVCDAGASIITSMMAGAADYSFSDIVRYFFLRNSSIAFVIAIAAKEEWSSRGPGRGSKYVNCTLHLNNNLDSNIENCLTKLTQVLQRTFPIPVNPAANSRSYLNYSRKIGRPHEGESLYGGQQMIGSNRLRIPSRTVLDLLAGRADYDSFKQWYGRGGNDFERMLKQGRMIKSVTVHPDQNNPATDDDWLEIEFGDPDSAIFPFREP
jgi:hypothetical protein